MDKTKIIELNELGQSAWLDNINRSMIQTGRLKDMINLGLRGLTSNPTIFDKAISKGNVYDKEIEKLRRLNKSTFEIYDELTIKDIQDACDIFKGVYKNTKALDGYVSLEIDPRLAFKTEESIKEGKRLYKKVNRPNLMLKVPSTKEGFRVVEELTAFGANINVTLIFSLEQYIDAAKSYINGITHLLKNKGDISRIHSVASVFVSRIDTAVDKLLEGLLTKEKSEENSKKLALLKGKAAVSNSQIIYKEFLDIFHSDEFKRLKDKGAHTQRVLWGSTSTKNPAYSDIKYVTELIGKDTVNTMPEATFEAFLDHGQIKEALTSDIKDANELIRRLKENGIDINLVCDQLLKDGVTAFEKSFESLLNSLNEKVKMVC